jgi:uncharacterized ion transporter superfamily protein YfcC
MAPSEDERRKHARKQLEKRRDFKSHLVVYIVVNLFLIGIWAISSRGYFWPAWVILGWGVGLVLNAWDVYFRRPISDDDIDRELGRGRGGSSS